MCHPERLVPSAVEGSEGSACRLSLPSVASCQCTAPIVPQRACGIKVPHCRRPSRSASAATFESNSPLIVPEVASAAHSAVFLLSPSPPVACEIKLPPAASTPAGACAPSRSPLAELSQFVGGRFQSDEKPWDFSSRMIHPKSRRLAPKFPGTSPESHSLPLARRPRLASLSRNNIRGGSPPISWRGHRLLPC